MEELRKAIAYIDEKQRFYADVTAGRTAYCSNVIDTTQSDCFVITLSNRWNEAVSQW